MDELVVDSKELSQLRSEVELIVDAYDASVYLHLGRIRELDLEATSKLDAFPGKSAFPLDS